MVLFREKVKNTHSTKLPVRRDARTSCFLEVVDGC